MRRTLLIGALLLFGQLAAGHEVAPAAGQDILTSYELRESDSPLRERDHWRKPRKIVFVADGARSELVRALAGELRSDVPGVELSVVSSADAAAAMKDADALIGTCDAKLIAAAPKLHWVQVYSAGVEHCVSVPSLRERHIVLTNMQRIGAPVIGEHVIAMVLAFSRGLDLYVPAQQQRTWRRITPPGRMTVVSGKTLLVVGLGGIGTEVARRAHALGMRVTATRASGRSGPDFVSYVGLPEELHKLAAQADVVVNTAPLTPQTVGMFDKGFFAVMKPTAYFINVARGRSVVTADLIDALNSGTIAGAGVDVTDPEPLPADHPLWRAKNIIITPHVANDSDLGFDAQAALVSENVRRFVAGERMLSEVDLQKGY